MEFIPVYRPSLKGNEKKYVDECLDSGWISSLGRFVNEFEHQFSDYIQVNHAISVSNGTVALHLALLALGLGADDEVIVPTFTYIASVNAISYTGAKPVFVDSLQNSWQMDPECVRKKITPQTKAILAVHLYGHPCEMDELCEIAKEFNLFLIEDCAEAFGSLYKGKHVGGFGDVATFSFYGNKTITTGEGGMVATNSLTLQERIRHLKGQGLAKYREYWHDIIGYNYRMTNICAAIGLAQLERADKIIEQKINIARLYQEGLKSTPYEFHKPYGEVRHVFWMFSILVPHGNQRDYIREYLKRAGIETRPTFYPAHTMPMYNYSFGHYKVAENLAERGINLPSFPELTEQQVNYINQSLIEALETCG